MMMEVTVDIPMATARKIAAVAGEVAGRQRSGPQTRVIAEVLTAVAEALPGFFEAGDNVVDKQTGERAVVDSFADGGTKAVIHDVDREHWRVINCDGLTKETRRDA